MFNRTKERKSKQSAKSETILLISLDDLKSDTLLHRNSSPILKKEYSKKIQHKIEIRIKEIRKIFNHLPHGHNQTASRLSLHHCSRLRTLKQLHWNHNLVAHIWQTQMVQLIEGGVLGAPSFGECWTSLMVLMVLLKQDVSQIMQFKHKFLHF
jgi:hypothetical protein